MMEPTTPFASALTSTGELEQLYRQPSAAVLAKVTDHLDEGCRDFLSVATFALVGTSDRDGRHDVSPRGGAPGFVRILDDNHLALPDLNGNNRLDTLRNIIGNPGVGLLFLVPGMGEMLRINGRAWITTDPELLDRFTDQVRRPTTAIAVAVDEAYLHCAKSIRRGGLWEPTTWPGAAERPSAARIFIGHLGAGDSLSPEQVEADLEAGYVAGLAADQPT